MRKKKNTKFYFILMILPLFLLFQITNCKTKIQPKLLSEKSKILMDRTWNLDTEAQRTNTLTKAGDLTGITNLKDIKLKKDVKKIADFLSAKTLYFGKEKDGNRLVYQETKGSGFLKSKTTGYWDWNKDETLLILTYKENNKEKTKKYLVKELNDKRLVLLKENADFPILELYKH